MVNGDDVTWYERSCGLGPEYDTPSSRLMIQSNPYELVSLILAIFAIPAATVVWENPTYLAGKNPRLFSAVLSVSVAVVAAQRSLYILYPHEFSTSSSTDVANLCVSGVGVAFATIWAAHYASMENGTQSADQSQCMLNLANGCRRLSRYLILAAWVLDVQRRRGWMVGVLGYTAIGLLALHVLKMDISARSMRWLSILFVVVGGLLLLSVQVLRPCHGYD
jgi:hypothetical protein